MKRHHLAAWIGISVFITACAGAPGVRYYLLRDQAPAVAAPSQTEDWAVEILDVRLARHLDRAALAQRTGPNELRYLSGHEWAATLPHQLGRTLASHLGASLAQVPVAPPGQASNHNNVLRLLVDVDRFERDTSQHAVVAARWQIIHGRSGETLATEQAEWASPAPLPDALPSTTVAALSSLYARLGDRIAGQLARFAEVAAQ